MATQKPETLWDETQAAAVLKLEPKTLNQWRARKKADQPPYVKVGRLVRYRPSAVAAWITERERSSSPAEKSISGDVLGK